MEPNKVLKKLRKERNISQSELASKISTRNTLGSYEHGGTSINYYILRQYLAKLNVSVEEFDFLTATDIKEYKKVISTKLKHLYYHHNYNDLIALLNEIKSKYETSHDFYYLHLDAQYRFVLFKEGIIHLDKKEIDFFTNEIKKYLDKIETWGQFESSVFINTMHIFDTTYVLQTIEYIHKKNIFYSTLYKKYQILEKMHLNALYLLSERKEFHLVPIILNSFKKTIDDDDLKNKVIISFFDGFIEKNESKKNKALQVLRTFDMHMHADYLASLYQ
ncbi:MAG: helix-turn-helix domain-containing protein [Enterococcus sp.]